MYRPEAGFEFNATSLKTFADDYLAGKLEPTPRSSIHNQPYNHSLFRIVWALLIGRVDITGAPKSPRRRLTVAPKWLWGALSIPSSCKRPSRSCCTSIHQAVSTFNPHPNHLMLYNSARPSRYCKMFTPIWETFIRGLGDGYIAAKMVSLASFMHAFPSPKYPSPKYPTLTLNQTLNSC